MRLTRLLPLAALLLSGCQSIGNWFDSVGEHMPVIGERCEHWQCFTDDGQRISDENKQREMMGSPPPKATQSPNSELPPGTPAQTPPATPPMPSSPSAAPMPAALPDNPQTLTPDLPPPQ